MVEGGQGESRTCAEGTEVLGSLGDNVSVELHGDTPCTAKRMRFTTLGWRVMQRGGPWASRMRLGASPLSGFSFLPCQARALPLCDPISKQD